MLLHVQHDMAVPSSVYVVIFKVTLTPLEGHAVVATLQGSGELLHDAVRSAHCIPCRLCQHG